MSLFSGIGAFEKALTNLGIPYDLVGFSETDKFAVKSYATLHNHDDSKNLGDIRNINPAALPQDIDLISYGFPCQSVSIAGPKIGFRNANGELTGSGLFIEALRIIRAVRPKAAIAENVKMLISRRFTVEFNFILDSLGEAGYNNYYKVYNAKDFGVPQNRERVFIVSIRKDIDQGFEFPVPNPVPCRLADVLEDDVPDKYYLSEKLVRGFIAKNERRKDLGFRFKVTSPDGISPCITATYHKCSSSVCYVAGSLNRYSWERSNRVYDINGISPTITTMGGGGQQIKIYVEDKDQN